jgi:hypothetical protein
LEDRSCLEVDSETGEIAIAAGEQLIFPWAGNINKSRKANGGDLEMSEVSTENTVSNSLQEVGGIANPMEMEMCIR